MQHCLIINFVILAFPQTYRIPESGYYRILYNESSVHSCLVVQKFAQEGISFLIKTVFTEYTVEPHFNTNL